MYLHKAGDATVLGNYRPITITCNFAKLYSALLNELLTYFVGTARIPSDNQQDTRPKRSAWDEVFIARQIRENAFKDSRQGILVFFDFRKHLIVYIAKNFLT